MGQAARAHCEALGGIWIKVGQLFSLRLDLFPASFCAALTGLQNRQGVGSIGRVTHDPTTGRAIKRVADGVPQAFAADLVVLDRVFWWASWIVPRLRLADAALELHRVVDEEVNLLYEAANQERMRETIAEHDIDVPEVFEADCTPTQLVTAWVDGVVMTDFLALSADARDAWCHARGTSQKLIAERLLLSFFRQVYEDNLFHGDLHPGNILLRLNGRVVLIDFGSVGTTDVDFLDIFRRMAWAIATGRYDQAADRVFLLCAKFPKKKKPATKAALIRVMQTWAAKTEVKGLAYHEKSLNACTTLLMQTVMQAGGYFQWAWLRIQRTLTTLDATVAALWPTVNYPKLIREYFRQANRRTPIWKTLCHRLPEYLAYIEETIQLDGRRRRDDALSFQGQ